MTKAPQLSAFAEARDRMMARLAPVAPRRVALRDALHHVLGDHVVARVDAPARPRALRDGYALRAADIVGASSYAPVALAAPPAFVAAGDDAPADCDCLLDAGALDLTGPMPLVLLESFPGENLRRIGEDARAGAILARAGTRLAALDLLALAQAGVDEVAIRAPRLALHAGAETPAAAFIAREAQARGATLATGEADLRLSFGPVADARIDDAALALEPGRAAALGAMENAPLIVCPAALDQALALWFVLVAPALDRLAGRAPTPPLRLPLARKIASRGGLAEVALLARDDATFTPLAVGDLPLSSWLAATHVALVAAESEGYPAGAIIEAQPLREGQA